MKKLIIVVVLLAFYSCTENKFQFHEDTKSELGLERDDYWSKYKNLIFEDVLKIQQAKTEEDFNKKIVSLNHKLDSVLYSNEFFFHYSARQILNIHDEVMPKIGEVMNLKKKLIGKADSMEGESAEALRDLANRLEDANSSMMSWMREWSGQYTKVMESTDLEAQKEWFTKEMEKVQEVKEKINGSLEQAKKELQ